jgi:hypothetical protein
VLVGPRAGHPHSTPLLLSAEQPNSRVFSNPYRIALRSSARNPRNRRQVEVDFQLAGNRTYRALLHKFAPSYCNFAYSALACLRTDKSGSASFQSIKKSS